MRCRPGVRIDFPDIDRDALLAFQRDHRRRGVRHLERHFCQLIVAVVLKVSRNILTRLQAGCERDGAGRKPLAGGLCSVDKRPQKTGHVGGDHVRPVNRDPVLGVTGTAGKMNGDRFIRKIRLAANGDVGRLRDGKSHTGQLVEAVILEKPRHVVAGLQHGIEHECSVGETLPRRLGAVHEGPGRSRGRPGDHFRPIDADPVLRIAGAVAENDLDRFADLINHAADRQAQRWRSLSGDAGGEISTPVGWGLQLPVRRRFRPGVEPKSPGAGSLVRFVVKEQSNFSDVAQTRKLEGPGYRCDLLGHPHAKVAYRDHVVSGSKRKGVTLEQKIARFFRAALPCHRAVVGVNMQHAFLVGLKRIQRSEILELNLVDNPLAAVECELVADTAAGKLDVILDSARIVVHHQAAGLQLHFPPGIHRHLLRCMALAVVKIEANLTLGYNAKRGQGGVVLKLDGRQFADIPVQNHRVRDLFVGEINLAERGPGVFINHHVSLLADGHPGQPCGKVGAVFGRLEFPLAIELLPKVVVTIAKRRGVVKQQARTTDAEVKELDRPGYFRGALRQIQAKPMDGDRVVFVLQGEGATLVKQSARFVGHRPGLG